MRVQAAFADLNPVHRSRPDLPLELTPEQCRTLRNLCLKTDLGIVDCLGEVLGVGNFEKVLKQSVEVELPQGKCRVLEIDALIRAKEVMNREHDRLTVKYLNEIKRQRSQK